MLTAKHNPPNMNHPQRSPWSTRGRVSPRMLAVMVTAAVTVLSAPLALASLASAEACPNEAFRTGPSAALPDCRAYEMVSPNYTNGQPIGTEAISPDGSTMFSAGLTAFAGAQSSEGINVYYRLARGAAEWSVTPLALPASRFMIGEFSGASGDLGVSLWTAREVGAPSNALGIYREREDDTIETVGPALPPSAPSGLSPENEQTAVSLRQSGVSSDGSEVFFDIGVTHWPFDHTQTGLNSLYEYVGAGNSEPSLVGVDDEGKQISDCGTVLGAGKALSGGGNGVQSSHNAVSLDGRTVFFTAYPKDVGCSASGPAVAEMYARVDNGLPDARTVDISEPSKEDCSECKTESGVQAEAHFEGASADGSKVFFSTTQPLLGSDTSRNVYEYDFDAPAGQRITRVTAGDSTVTNPTASLADALTNPPTPGRVVQISEDGSHVYFVANGVLTTNENSQGASARKGAENLYVVDTEEGTTEFIADLCSGQDASGSVRDARCPASTTTAAASSYDASLWASYAQAGSNVTPDGRFLVFTSYGDLTPDDTSSALQVFEYDSSTETLVRVSVGQNGFNDNGNTAAADASIRSPSYTGSFAEIHYEATIYGTHLSVSANGSSVFFQSGAGLTPHAVNLHFLSENIRERLYVHNVYEYHSVNGDIAEGNVYLISDGQDIHAETGESTVLFEGTDMSGRDVFFQTDDQLVPQDSSEVRTTFDARIDGGFAPPAPPASCEPDACQGGSSAPPVLLSPGSEFQAGGNPPLTAPVVPAAVSKPKAKAKPKKCKRGTRLVHGKCVKAKAKAKKARGDQRPQS